jgi:hypothetical protein
VLLVSIANLLKAANLEEARALAFSDPVHTSGSSFVTVYEWHAKSLQTVITEAF